MQPERRKASWQNLLHLLFFLIRNVHNLVVFYCNFSELAVFFNNFV